MKLNRQLGFIAASVSIFFVGILSLFDDPAKFEMYLLALFPPLIFCLTNVMYDVFQSQRYSDADGRIIYDMESKMAIFITSLVFNAIAFAIASALLASAGGYAGILILISVASMFLTYIGFSIGMRLIWYYGVAMNILLPIGLYVILYIVGGLF